MKFSQSLKKSSFDEPKNYYPNPQYYQNKSLLPPKEFKMTFGHAERFDTIKSMESNSPISQLQLNKSPKNNNSDLKLSDVIQIYQRNKRGVFKSTFKNIKNSIELSPEYGEGLFKIMQQYDNKLKQDAQSPGPAEYNPSFSIVSKRVQSQIISPVIHDYNNNSNQQPNLNRNNSDSIQILVENNKVPKIGLLPKLERDRQQEVKEYQIKQPKYGVLRKAKIAKNIFDQAKEDEFDPSPESSSIELFLLRQKLLGTDEVPPPGHYFDSERCSSFQLKKNSSVNIHFDSTEQRLLTFGNTITNRSDDEDDEEEYYHNEQNNQNDNNDYRDTSNSGQGQSNRNRKKSNFSQATNNNQTNSSQHYNTNINNDSVVSKNQYSKYKNKSNYINTTQRTSTHPSISSQQQYKSPNFTKISFSKSKKTSFFDTFSNPYPGPGSYTVDYNQKLKTLDSLKNKPDIYYKSSFGSGSVRFQNLKTVEF